MPFHGRQTRLLKARRPAFTGRGDLTIHHRLRTLSPHGLRRYLRLLAWLHFEERLSLLPLPLRLGVLHMLCTIVFLLHSPPPPHVPPLFIPIVWAGSFATTLALWSLGRVVLQRSDRNLI